MEVPLHQDPRWIKLHDCEWICPFCGKKHTGLFDLACDGPDFWKGPDEKSPNSAVLSSNHVLTEDFCVLHGEHFFVRCVLQLPIIGSDEFFGYGVWSTVSKKNFDICLDTFDEGRQGRLGPWFGWLSNRLKGYPNTINLKCQLHPRDGRQRPYVELEPTEHPLAVEQQHGITFDRVLDIYALHGHDLRPALMNG